MNSKHCSAAGRPAASEEYAGDLAGVIDRLCRAGYFTGIVSMAVDSMDGKREQCAFAVTLQQISDELADAKRELYAILRGEGGAA